LRILRVELVLVCCVVYAILAHVVSFLLLGSIEEICVLRAHVLLADDTPIQGALRMLNVALAHAATVADQLGTAKNRSPASVAAAAAASWS
jgi:hypothetical protein